MTFLEVLLVVLSGVLAYRLYLHRRYLHKMLAWISGPLDDPLPDASGVWGEFVSGMNRRVKSRRHEKAQLEQALEQFQSALEALPDGVVFMDNHRRILWTNELAVKMLKLKPGHDIGSPIEQLIREPEFANYLLAGKYNDPLLYHPNRREQSCFMVSLISYSEDRLLLTVRDLTQLEKLENMRRDFVANVSHELKTPLTVISGFLETLQMHHQTLSSEKTQRFLDLAMGQAQQMGRLVQDLLTLSSLETRANLVDEGHVNVKTLVEDLIVSAEAISAGKHKISVDLPEKLVIRGSNSAIRSIFGNLIHNAVNYTPNGGNIRIYWKETLDSSALCVEDNGIGIPEIHIPRLSERFYRVDRGRSKDTGGTGLGLAIVKHALSRHEGYLDIRSQVGLGSTFEAWFPNNRICKK